ncbi:predicted protein [Naegleria gruberi]|uniref:Predicted protein n=1 Tax=Naegleria gruberi TaxID=5762 RepID=D2VTZ0_NAEGR|nr:uncharacterized protein NAEGRDRAFT_52233 [Naegleria gruberi]EFC39804.1 predicted protein [Naegleria gruberi]|eukprot:XP_002672548.1 predicted protein [Naegleria gruberi strain NEG-M]
MRTCLLNFLATHEYELARALFIDYFKTVSESDTLFILNHCIEELKDPKNPHVTSRFKWFCYCVYTELQQLTNNSSLKGYNIDVISFETLLDCCVNTFKLSDKFSKELVRHMKYIYSFRLLSKKKSTTETVITTLSSTGLTFSQNMDSSIMDLIGEMYEKCPFLAFYLERNAFEFINGKSILIEKLENLCNDRDYEKASYMLRFISKQITMDSESIYLLKNIFKQLIENKAIALKSRPNNQLIDIIYESLFIADISDKEYSDEQFKLTRIFTSLDEELLSKQKLIDIIQASPSSQSFWFHYMEYIRVTNNHILESGLNLALDLVAKKDYASLNILLDQENFSNMRPLIILLSWDNYKSDITERHNIIQNIWIQGKQKRTPISDPWVEFTCNELAFFLDFSLDASELLLEANRSMNTIEKKHSRDLIKSVKMKKLAENDFKFTNKKEIANLLIDLAPSQSTLNLLLPWLGNLKENDLVSLLKKRPQLRETTENERNIDLTLLRAYFAIHEAIQIVRNKSTSILDSLKSIEDSIVNISSESYRLSTLENIFQIILTKSSHIKGHTDNNSVFVISPNNLHDMLVFLKTATELLQQSSKDERMVFRIERFVKILDEALWRFSLTRMISEFDRNSLNSSYKQHQFVQMWTASPNTLFVICIKRNLFSQAKEVITRFNLGESFKNQVIDAEIMYTIHNEHKDKSVGEIIQKFPNFITLFDVLFSLKTENKELHGVLIEKIKELKPGIPLLDLFAMYLDSPYQGPIFRVYSKLFNYNREDNIEILRKYIEVEKTKSTSLKDLCIYDNRGFENEKASKLADLNGIHILSFILESASQSKISKSNDLSISLDLAKIISQKSSLVGALSSLYFADYSKMNPQFLEFIESQCQNSEVMNRWMAIKLEPVKDAIQLSKRLDLSRNLKKYTISSFESDQADSLYLAIIQNLIDADDYNLALEMAEKGLTHFTPDFLLKLYIENMPDHSECHKYIYNIKDKELAFSLIEIYMDEWDIEVCIELIRSCCSTFRSDKTKQKIYERASKVLERLHIFKEVLSSELRDNYDSWTEMKEICDHNPYRFISDLITVCEFDLARRAAKNLLSTSTPMNIGEGYDSVMIHIEQEYCLYILGEKAITDKIISKVTQALSRLSPENALSVCKHVLEKLEIYENKLFVCEFILSVYKEHLKKDQLEQYTASLMGMRVLKLLDEENKKKYNHLLLKPSLIIENLIINNEMLKVSRILNELPELQNDDLLIEYGMKALSLKNFEQTDTTKKKSSSRVFTLNNEEHNNNIRINFSFPQAPSILLAKSILDICKNNRKVGDSILTLCDEISKTQHISRTNRISLVGQIVRYAKICFSKDTESHERLGLCDTILSHVEILKQIIYHNCAIGSISLSDLSQQNRARQIRDSLIQLDHLNLALNVATRCQIESDPIWTQWGITLLTLGKYKQARDKLKYCLTLTPQQKQQLLNRILAILEGAPSVVAVDQKMGDKLKESVLDSPGNSPSKKRASISIEQVEKSQLHTHLDEERMREAQYYIKHFGSSDIYISFLVRNGKLDAAILYLFKKQMSQSLFVDVIVTYCVKYGLMKFLQNVIKQYDTTFTKCYPYLTATCKYLNQKQALNLLYDFQVFMDDNIRAGLTKIRLFLKTDDQNQQLSHLEGAKKHFMTGLQNSSTENDVQKQVLKPDEISRYVKTINLQTEVTKKFGNVMSPSTPNTKITLFDAVKGKCEITEFLMLQSFDLSFRIASEFHLPMVKLYIRTLCSLVRKKQIAIIENLLKQIRGTPISDEDWDAIINNIIKLYIKEMNDEKNAEKFIAKLRNDSKKVRACLLCNRFKAAYLIAVKCDNLDDVKLIFDYCNQVDSKATQTIAEHCLKYLKDHGVQIVLPTQPTSNSK